MNNTVKESNSNNTYESMMILASIKSHELIRNIIMTYIWPKLCTVKEIVIPDVIPELEFNKLLANILNIFKQNDHAFPENLKSTIKELVLETFKEMCNDATNYILEKVKSTNKVFPDIKILETKIIINKNKIENSINNHIPIWKSLNKNSPTKIKRDSAGIICSNTRKHEKKLIDNTKKDAFGKTQNWYLNDAKNTFNKFNYEDIQILYGTIHFIKAVHDVIKEIPEDKLKIYEIIKITDYLYEIHFPLSDKSFFNFFSNPDKKIGKNKEATKYQTYTKKKILNKLRAKIAPFRFPIIRDNLINFMHPLKEIDPFDFNSKSKIRIVIDTRILLPDYTKQKEAFLFIPQKEEIIALGNAWDEVVKRDIINSPKLNEIYKKYRIGQYKDTPIKFISFLSSLYRGLNENKQYPQAKSIAPISKEELENKILNESRIIEYLKTARNYNPSNRINTITTIKKIKSLVTLITLKVSFKGNYIKEPPKLNKNNKKYPIKLNAFKFDKAKAHTKKIEFFKIKTQWK